VVQSSHADAVPIWARREPSTRRPRFSREQIAAAALAIADGEGFEAVSMRRIAAMLGAGTMSLYRYIATKADLIALLDDALFAEALVPGALPADWREALSLVARQTRRTYLHHPWAVQILQGKAAAQAALAGPNGLRHSEQSLAALAGAPLDARGKLQLLGIVDDYVIGHVLRAAELMQRNAAAPDSAAAPATTEFLRDQLESGEFPRLAAIAEGSAAILAAGPAELEARFELGLRLLIDGISQSGPASA
jgi:AcrR family transcriptional regulator